VLQGFPSHWTEVRIGDILRYLDEQVVFNDTAEYITITVKRRHGGLEARERLFGHEIKTKKQYRLHPGAFIISRVQCWHAAFAIVPNDIPENMIASQNYDQFEISPIVDKRFFWWLSHSPQFIETVRSSASGVVVEKLVFNRDAWLQKTISIPAIDEQRQIALRIDAIAAKLENAQAIKKNIEAELNQVLMATYHQIANGAERKPLSEVAPLYRRPAEVSVERNYPQIAVRSFGRGTFHKSDLDGAEITWQKPYQVKTGDILISNIKAWEGAIAVVNNNDDGRYGSHRYLTCVPVPNIATSHFVCFHLLTPEGMLAIGEASPGSADRNRTLGTKALMQISIPVPSFEKQLWFDELCTKVNALRELQSQSQEELDALLPSVLDRAFKGEV